MNIGNMIFTILILIFFSYLLEPIIYKKIDKSLSSFVIKAILAILFVIVYEYLLK